MTWFLLTCVVSALPIPLVQLLKVSWTPLVFVPSTLCSYDSQSPSSICQCQTILQVLAPLWGDFSNTPLVKLGFMCLFYFQYRYLIAELFMPIFLFYSLNRYLLSPYYVPGTLSAVVDKDQSWHPSRRDRKYWVQIRKLQRECCAMKKIK